MVKGTVDGNFIILLIGFFFILTFKFKYRTHNFTSAGQGGGVEKSSIGNHKHPNVLKTH